VIGLAVMVVAVVVAALVTAVRGGPGAWESGGAESVGEALWHFGLLQSLGVLQGLAFGMFFLNTAAAVVTYFVLPFVSTLVFNLVPQLQDAGPWLDTGTAQQVLTQSGLLTATQWGQLATSTLIWVVVPLVVGVWRILRSEVK
jgi:hypothetical protein